MEKYSRFCFSVHVFIATQFMFCRNASYHQPDNTNASWHKLES